MLFVNEVEAVNQVAPRGGTIPDLPLPGSSIGGQGRLIGDGQPMVGLAAAGCRHGGGFGCPATPRQLAECLTRPFTGCAALSRYHR
jgi:hypothetical protein